MKIEEFDKFNEWFISEFNDRILFDGSNYYGFVFVNNMRVIERIINELPTDVYGIESVTTNNRNKCDIRFLNGAKIMVWVMTQYTIVPQTICGLHLTSIVYTTESFRNSYNNIGNNIEYSLSRLRTKSEVNTPRLYVI